jgi:Glycosyltransferase family 87
MQLQRGLMTSRLPASLRASVILTSAAVVLLIGCSVVAWKQVRTAEGWDTPLYQFYGQQIVDGRVPYRDFRAVYPPAALPAFVAASHNLGFPGTTRDPVWRGLNPAARRYARSFAIEMVAALAIAIAFTAASLRTLRASTMHVAAALGVLATSPLLLGDLIFTRFDALPAALTAVATSLLLRAHFGLAGLSLGLGVATKLYPAILVPLAATYAWKRRGRREAAAVVISAIAVTLVIFLPFIVIAPHGALWPVRAQFARGLHVESLASSVVVALHVLTGQLHLHGLPVSVLSAPVGWDEALSTNELRGTAAQVAGLATGVLAGLVLFTIWIEFARKPVSDALLVRYASAAITAQVALGRVLSPQFLIWLLPLVPLVGGRLGGKALLLVVSALAITNVWFPDHYLTFINTERAGPTGILLLRNAVLVVLLVVLLVTRRRAPTVASSAPLPPGGATSPG